MAYCSPYFLPGTSLYRHRKWKKIWCGQVAHVLLYIKLIRELISITHIGIAMIAHLSRQLCRAVRVNGLYIRIAQLRWAHYRNSQNGSPLNSGGQVVSNSSLGQLIYIFSCKYRTIGIFDSKAFVPVPPLLPLDAS